MDIALYFGKDQPRIEKYSVRLDELTLGNSGFPGCLVLIGSFDCDLNSISIPSGFSNLFSG